MTHIALFIPELECGGAQRVFLQLSREFAARGHKVDLVLAQARGTLLNEIDSSVKLIDLGAKSGLLGMIGLGLSSALRLRHYLRREMPEVLLSTLTGANLVAVAAQTWYGNGTTRLVLREAVTLGNRTGRSWQWLMRWIYPKAYAVITLSPVMLREMIDMLGIPGHKVFYIPNPVDTVTIRALSEVPIDDARFELDGLSFILSVGRLTFQKDYETLIRAFAGMVQNPDIHLVILGEGDQRPELELLVKQLKLQGRVYMPGHKTNPWCWMRRASLFVLSSRWEGHPNALLEALAMGLPVVSTEYDESARTTVGNCGQVVPIGDVLQMTSAIDEMLNNPPTAMAPEYSSVTKIASRYLDLLCPPL